MSQYQADWSIENERDNATGLTYYSMTLPIAETPYSGMVCWWHKMLDLASEASGWDVILCDLWIDNTGRIIGHVQKGSDPVGVDKGFRVCITLREYADQLACAYAKDEATYDDVYSTLLAQSEILLAQPIDHDADIKKRLTDLQKSRSFSLYFAIRGGEGGAANEEYFIEI